MNKRFIKKILKLYPEYHTVYGPYKRKQDNRTFILLYDGKNNSARLLSKIKIEVKLNRRLINDETVDHIDEDVTNDDIDNLQILSRLENIKKGFENGSLKCNFISRIGEQNPSSVLTENQVKEIRRLYNLRESKYDRNYSYRKLAKQFNVCRDTIGKIINRKAWKHI